MAGEAGAGRPRWLYRVAWLVAIWAASVAALAAAAWALRLLMGWAGMTA